MFEGCDLDDDDPEAWPDVEQQKLDESLRCAICGDLFTMPCSLSTCTHTYCSLCIRRTLEFKSECPTCRAPGSSDDLRPNHTLEVVVSAFKAARAELLACVRRKHQAPAAPTSFTSVEKARAGATTTTTKKRKSRERDATIGKPSSRDDTAAAAAHSPAKNRRATRRTTRQSAQATTSKEATAAATVTKTRSGAARMSVSCPPAGGVSTYGGAEGPSSSKHASSKRNTRRNTSQKDDDGEGEEADDFVDDDEAEAEDRDAGEEGDEDYDLGEEEEEEEEPVSESDWDPDASQQQVAARNNSNENNNKGAGTSGGNGNLRGKLHAEMVDLLDDDDEDDDDEDDDDDEEEEEEERDAGRGSRKRAKRGGGGGSGLAERQPLAATPGHGSGPGGSGQKQRPGTVNCPICNVGILEGFINSHVDVCLTKGGGGENVNPGGGGGGGGGGSSEKRPGTPAAKNFITEGPPQQQPLMKLPKLVYHIMKDKRLKELLVNAGLNPAGTRAAMEKRHKEFTLRVNATIDSGHHPNVAAIAREVTKLERDRDRAGLMTAVASSGLTGPAPTAAAAETSKADTFSRLIASVKQRAQSVPKPPTKEEKEGNDDDDDDDDGADEGMMMTERDDKGLGDHQTVTESPERITETGTDEEDAPADAALNGRDGGGGEGDVAPVNDGDGEQTTAAEDTSEKVDDPRCGSQVEEDGDAAVEDSQDGCDEDDDEWQNLPLSQVPRGGLAAARSA